MIRSLSHPFPSHPVLPSISMMAVASIKTIRLNVPANKAKPSPAIGQALGQLGINMMRFCKECNAASTHFRDDLPLRVRLLAMPDGTYTFTLHPPPTSYFLKRAARIERGAQTPGVAAPVGVVHVKQIYEIARTKQLTDPNPLIKGATIEAISKQIAGQCRSMGLTIDASREDEPPMYVKTPALNLTPRKAKK